MKQKKELSVKVGWLMAGLLSLVVVGVIQVSTVAADPKWGPDYDCSQEKGDATPAATWEETCEEFKQQCGAGFSTDAGQFTQSECEAAGYSYNDSGSPAGSKEDKCDPSTETCCGNVKTSIITDKSICDASEEDGGVIFGLLKGVLKIMTAGVGIAAVGGIAWGALLYTTAESKPEQTKKAIGVITNVVIGIAAYALMYVALQFLIPGGVFN